MNKRVIQVMQWVLASAIVLFLGVQFGIRMQAGHQEDVFATMAQSGRIAVVNTDLGALYQGEHMYFAANVIETLSEDFVLVSRSVAETGLANGNFAAVISFPVDFSERITQINSVRPAPARFSYQLNTNLSQRDTIITMLRILDLEQHINETVSFMFVASILGELHDAQDTTGDLLVNNQTDIYAVREFSTTELIPNIVISQMERIFPEIEHPNFLTFIEENNRVMLEINTRHREHLEEARTSYTLIVSNLMGAISSSTAISDAIGSINMLPAVDGGGNQFDAILYEALQATRERFEEAEEELLKISEDLLYFINDTAFPTDNLIIATTPQALWDALSPALRDSIEDFIDDLSSATSLSVLLDYYIVHYEYYLPAAPETEGQGHRTPLASPDENIVYGDDEYYYDNINADAEYENSAPFAPSDEGAEYGSDSHYYENNAANTGRNYNRARNIRSVSVTHPEEDTQANSNYEQSSNNISRSGFVPMSTPSPEALEFLSIVLEIAEMQRDHSRDFYRDFFYDYRDEVIYEVEAQFELIEILLAQLEAAEQAQLTAIVEEMTSYILTRQAVVSSGLSGVFNTVFQRLNESGQNAATFDPTRYVMEHQGELNNLSLQFGENNREWSMHVNEAIASRTEQVFQTFMHYDEHVRQLQDDMRDVVVESQHRFYDAQGQLLYIMTYSHNLNNQLIGEFGVVLPHSRIGAQANTDFYSFVVSPVRMDEIGGGTQAAFAEMELREVVATNRVLPYIIAVLLISLSIIVVVRYGVKSLRRQNGAEL